MNAALEFFAPDFLIPALGRARISAPTKESPVDSLEAERRGTAQLLEQAVDLGAIVTEFPVVAAIQPLDLEVQFAPEELAHLTDMASRNETTVPALVREIVQSFLRFR